MTMLRRIKEKNTEKEETGALLFTRVADPVHFRPDPDPANQNFKNRIRILLAHTKNQFKYLNFVHINQIF